MSEVVPVNNSVLASFIDRAARDPEFDVQKFGELLRMQREVEHDQARKAFNRAMAEAQAEMLPVVRLAQNKHLGNKYAKLEDIDRGMRPIYTKYGFSVRYGSAPAPREDVIRLTCTVAHAAGYFEENYLDAPLGNPGSQGGRTATTPVQSVGSAVTYLRRYLLGMVFNIVLSDEMDDDGEGTRRSTRDAINDATPMQPLRSAAAATPRPERRAGPVYDATPDPLDEQDGRKWLLNLDMVLANAQSQDEVVQIGGHASVGHATASAPEHVKRRVSELLAKAFARFAPDADADLDEVVIAGEAKLAAG